MKKILNKLTNHFEDNRTLACITAGLFALGILIFIINNTVLFLEQSITRQSETIC